MLYDRRHELSPAARDLLAAADYIREHGWCQLKRRNENGAVCILGAVLAVTKDLRGYYSAVLRLPQVATGGGHAAWNDKPGRTVEEVLEILEKAAWAEQDVAAADLLPELGPQIGQGWAIHQRHRDDPRSRARGRLHVV